MQAAPVRRCARWAVVACGIASLLSCSSADSAASPRDIEISTPDGGVTTLAAFAGRPVVVNMWATWCGPCVAEMPVFDTVAAATDSVDIIGVNVGDTATEALEFAEGLGVTYPILTDPDGRLSTALGVNGLPATAFIAADGTVLDLHQGAYTLDELEAAIDASFPSTTP